MSPNPASTKPDRALCAVTGLVGSGKTLLLSQLHDILVAEKRVTVSKLLAIDKERTSLTTLITAVFYDLSTEKEPKSSMSASRYSYRPKDKRRAGPLKALAAALAAAPIG